MDLLLSFLWGLGGVSAIFATVFAAIFWWLHDLWQDAVERERWAHWLDHNAGRWRYRKLIAGALDHFSGFLCRREIAIRKVKDSSEAEIILEDNKRPWPWGLLDFTLLLAIAYPILTLLAQWSVTGAEGRIGALTVLPAGVERWERIALIGCILGFFVLLHLARRSKAQWRLVFFVLTIGSLLVTLAVSVAAAVTFAAAGTVAVAIAAAAAIGFSVAVAGAGAFAFAFAVAIAGAAALISAFTGAVVIAVLVIVGLATVGVVADERRSRAEHRPSLLLLTSLFALLALLVTASIWQQPGKTFSTVEIATLLLFLGFLPLLNAVADYLSTGLTRWLLGKGARGRTWFFTGSDIVLGGLTFVGLGFAVIATIALVMHLGGPALIDLGLLLAPREAPLFGGPPRAPEGSILGSPHEYWWLYITFLSTLLPTLAHGVIATLAFFAVWPGWVRRPIAAGLRTGTRTAGRPACLALAALMALSVVAVLAVIFYGGGFLFTHYPAIGETLVALFRWWAGVVLP